MSNTSNSTELALQICFGVFGIMGTIATLAGLHHRDSLGCVLLPNMLSKGLTMPLGGYDDDDESAISGITDDQDNVVNVNNNLGGRRPTLPPSYDQSSENPHSEAFHRSDIDASLLNSKDLTSNPQLATIRVASSALCV
ncbi:hypothetical protein EJ02DRAFT_494062 [Clathrospora elynae]|uniref:Uncharacterized protein n=1 Tax=Clathrospora elynae TaxID=706981 RepID=A0A6A5SMI5_9PLEO|nr:hypothetical protein EJ02DRAFT_494062 [Clathrospora elynae]